MFFVLILPILVSANPDLNNDGEVDIEDLIIVASNFGTSNTVADTDNNNIVDIFDVVYVASRFGTVTPPPPPPGNEVYADTCSRTDIQAAIDSAEDGDVIVIPEGDCTFDSPYRVMVTKHVSFKGQGPGKTILRKNSDQQYYGILDFYRHQTGNDNGPEISGIKLVGEGSETYVDYGIMLLGGSRNFKIHDCVFEGFGGAGVAIKGVNNYGPVREPWGVIYDCTFIDNYKPGYGYGVYVGGNDSVWDEPLVLGNEKAVFIEDNYFSGNRHAVASSWSSKYVFRKNTITSNRGGSYIDAHGNRLQGNRGSRSYEIYENTLSYPGSTPYPGYAVGIRGGDGVIFNNVFTNIKEPTIRFVNEVCPGCGCYPCPDQVREAYVWGNTLDGEPVNGEPTVCQDCGEYILREDRDIFNYQKPGYTPYPYPHPLRGEAPDNIVEAASCSYTDVQTALDAASDGDIVLIPAGTCTWTYSLRTNKAVHFKGAGQDVTIIQLDINTWQDNEGSLMRWQAGSATAYNPKWSDMTLSVLNGPVGKIGIRINYGAKDFMIWNCTFNNWGFAGVAVMGYDGDSPDLPNWDNSGVIFDCTFNDCWMQGYGYGVYVGGEDDEAWADGMELGTSQAVFIEDNYFTGSRHSIASSAGSRYVARYNYLYGQEFNTEHIIDAHGWTGIFDGEHRVGSLQYEIYGNEIEGNSLGRPVGIKIRGGNGVIFDNTFFNMNNQYTIFLDHDNRGHCINEETYPCKDQITDLYIWGNTDEGVEITSEDIHVYDYAAYDLTNYIAENRDWFMYQKPGYTPYPYPHPLRSS